MRSSNCVICRAGVRQDIGLGVSVIAVSGGRIGRLLQFRRQPDQRFVVADLEAVGAEAGRAAYGGVGDRHAVCDVDRRLAVLGADDDQRVDRRGSFAFSSLTNWPSASSTNWNAGSARCRAWRCCRGSRRSGVLSASALPALASFWPTLTAWKFMPKIAGTAALGGPRAVVAVDPVQHGLDLERVVGANARVALGVVVAGLAPGSSVSCELISGANSSSMPLPDGPLRILIGRVLVGPRRVACRRP